MKALAKSFVFACQGFIYCLHYERNMRIHLAFSLYMYSFLIFYDFFKLSKLEFAVLFIANALVMMGELINTAVETTINLVEKKYNKMARIAKDTAAAGVLIAAVFAVAIGVVLLWQPDAFEKLFSYYANNTVMLVCFSASLIISLIYIFIGPLAIRDFLHGKSKHTHKYHSKFKGAKK